MSRQLLLALKTAAWLACLAPFLRLVCLALTGGLGANPIEFVILATGKTALTLLVVSLAITPLRWWTGFNWLHRFRRLTGLFAFFYACLHFCAYAGLDKFFSLREIIEDVVRRPFITAGSVAFLALFPLAATSTAGAIRRLGGRRWQALHRLAYASGIAAVVHFWWKVKADVREPAIYAGLLGFLLASRLVHRFVSSKSNPR